VGSYAELARTLPVPTAEQTHAFAQRTSRMQHGNLGVSDEVAYVFFLDPNAGREKRYPSERELAFAEIEKPRFDGDEATGEYRGKYGHWNARRRDIDPRLKLIGADLVLEAPGAPIVINRLSSADRIGHETYWPDHGGWHAIPEELLAAGSVGLGAFARGVGEPPVAGRPEWRVSHLFQVPDPGLGADSLSKALKHSDVLPALPEGVARALRPLLGLWRSEGCQQDFLQAGKEGGPVRREMAWHRTASYRQQTALLGALIAALVAEQERHVDRMVAAMNRFLWRLTSGRSPDPGDPPDRLLL